MVTFNRKRLSDIVKVAAGASGSFTVETEHFVPNFIEVGFKDVKHTSGVDEVYWEVARLSATNYEVTVTYAVREAREIRYVVQDMYVNPEQTVNH